MLLITKLSQFHTIFSSSVPTGSLKLKSSGLQTTHKHKLLTTKLNDIYPTEPLHGSGEKFLPSNLL